MVKITLMRGTHLIGVGQVGMCEHAGKAMDALLQAGYTIHLRTFDPDKHPIPEWQRENFLEAMTQTLAQIHFGHNKHK